MDTSAQSQRDFLVSVLVLPLAAPSPSPHSTSPTRPHVTLTYAQSLDGCIAGVGGKQLILSGRESMIMTHWLRTMHDGILVGIGTALNDDPQLNARHLPTRDQPYPLPRPIILDTDLRLSPSCKLVQNYQQKQGRRPWLVCSNVYSPEKLRRKHALEDAGARIVEVPAPLSLDTILSILHSLGINSLMVEGGQRIISSFLLHKDLESNHIVDNLIVTVSPVFVGAAGVGALSQGLESVRICLQLLLMAGLMWPRTKVPKLDHVKSVQFGRDTVMACRVAR